MKFRQRKADEPEINLIAFIDVLLVILIFLMLSTTYSRFTELQVTLPTANADKLQERPREIIVAISADGRYAVNRQAVEGRTPELLAAALQQASAGQPETMIIISADANAAHQAVVNVMDAARRAGLNRLTFAAQGDAAK
ncbi:biopolymer transporter ExbD [Paucibacter sp. O1-1]|uniref:ExbD/TolR family protein n=1 Tax=unclassified Roseateles TaxID=2626991 RepID=UPI0021D50EF8|nr:MULTISPECIES: biopolymer transporter ExbD [unclassified Roseateles]MCU7370138.1 biopolymer transporter ExbD [Paucibacter sp. O1-1]MCZ7883851.1 biopolymer transporter ExbD [Paucibacter sp. M5-1]MDA3825123.1 biopolymer transporter ExbD [Paucibacter sp. O1-1]MDC6171091.1 biopolymer transporter ExbD [Paucibacter sp. XJ19-41]